MQPDHSTDTRVSVIVPTLNEERVLPQLLRDLLAEAALHEIIVVDGGSTDQTKEIVRAMHDQRLRLLESAPGRGKQMNIAARAATGDILLFHHADTVLPRVACTELLATCQDPNVRWGGYQHQFSQPNWKLRMISWLHNFRFRCTGVVYGDQSMFVRRAFFQHLGGFVEAELEDLEFSDRALAQTDSTALLSHVITDSRKFRQMGEFRALRHVVSILLRYQSQRQHRSAAFFAPYR